MTAANGSRAERSPSMKQAWIEAKDFDLIQVNLQALSRCPGGRLWRPPTQTSSVRLIGLADAYLRAIRPA
jgi:hypothetical protein